MLTWWWPVQSPKHVVNTVDTACTTFVNTVVFWLINTFYDFVCDRFSLKLLEHFSTSPRLSLEPLRPPLEYVPAFFSRAQTGQGAKLTTHFHLAPMLRMSGVVLPLPLCLYTVLSWAGPALTSYLIFIPSQVGKWVTFFD